MNVRRTMVSSLALFLLAGGLAACSTGSGGSSRQAVSAASKSERPVVGSMAVLEGQLVPAPAIPMGDAATIARILDEGKNRNQVMDHLTYFCTTFGPRLTGSTSLEQASRWAAGQFESWGLSNAHLWEWGTIPVRFDRGPSTARVVNIAPDGSAAVAREMDFTTLAWTIGTNGPVRGNVVKMPRTLAELEATRGELAGAWLLITPDAGNRQGIRGVGGTMNTRYTARKAARELMARGESSPTRIPPPEGPGVSSDVPITGRWEGIVAHPALPEGSTTFVLNVGRGRRGMFVGNVELPTLGVDTPIRDATFENDVLRFAWTTPAGDSTTTLTLDGDALAGDSILSNVNANDPAAGATFSLKRIRTEDRTDLVDNQSYILEQVLAAGPAGFVSSSGDQRVWTTSASGWRDLDLDAMPRDIEIGISEPDYDYLNSRLADGRAVTIEVDLDHRLTQGPIPVYNVIAEIPGTDLPDEVVIISAHFDSWNGPGSMGTTDNGTGSAVMMEAARILRAAGARPRRTIRVILWSGEEQGLLGARAYVATLSQAERDRIVACFVDDGGTNYQGGLGAPDVMIDYLQAATAPVNNVFYCDVDGRYLNVNIRSTGNSIPAGGSSDHAAFNAVGVPGFFWDEIGRANYGYGWHTQFDRLDLAIPIYLRQSATATAITAYNLACAPEILPRPAAAPRPAAGR